MIEGMRILNLLIWEGCRGVLLRIEIRLMVNCSLVYVVGGIVIWEMFYCSSNCFYDII